MKLLNNKYPARYALLELFLACFVCTHVSPFVSVDENLWNFSGNHYVYWLYSAFLIVFILHFARLTSATYFRDEFCIPKFRLIFIWESFLIFIKLVIFIVVLLLILYLCFKYFFPKSWRSWVEADVGSFRWNMSSKESLYLMAITSLFTGAVEELLYRSFVITKLKQVGFGSFVSAIFSSIIFAFGHVYYGFVGAFITFILGLLLAFIYLRYNNVYYVSLVHSIYNTAVSAVIFVLS
ncbi:type II CAAX endopeptidase family protein [Borrelia sp. BU AG58]|uniref:CPBP family intramembrane glutamic endopeptidase n=1 Tax=Borrelia sp. BU AG58 TaxID=2887345 RepID=UPI001E4765FC|nr:type II CAAX endopeptidase family protein [Borrelia sp. BU AG58]UER67752.1 type II CAAX endopeptidase family protein [Borrelia sp. BU AG58]